MSYLAQPSMEPQKSCPFSEASSPVLESWVFDSFIRHQKFCAKPIVVLLLIISSLGFQVSFTLLNADPDSVLAEWDIEAAVQSK